MEKKGVGRRRGRGTNFYITTCEAFFVVIVSEGREKREKGVTRVCSNFEAWFFDIKKKVLVIEVGGGWDKKGLKEGGRNVG